MTPMDWAWRTSTHSTDRGECVEVADAPRVSAVRDTKNRDLGALFFPSSEWSNFVETAKHESF